MNLKTADFTQIFNQCIHDYHIKDNIQTQINNPFDENLFENILYKKCWIDTVQWHIEDLIREPKIEASLAVELKRKIDAHNQIRTDLVEQIDDYFFEQFKNVVPQTTARYNTETIGWAIDRLSILCLKIYHMHVETQRTDADKSHLEKCQQKFNVLHHQQKELSIAIDQLREMLAQGEVKNTRYKQMKMYNDPSTNPVLYAKK